VHSPAVQRGSQLRASFGLCFLQPPSGIHRLRLELGNVGMPPVVVKSRPTARPAKPITRRRRKGAARRRPAKSVMRRRPTRRRPAARPARPAPRRRRKTAGTKRGR
jgi:hypothetical protein